MCIVVRCVCLFFLLRGIGAEKSTHDRSMTGRRFRSSVVSARGLCAGDFSEEDEYFKLVRVGGAADAYYVL